MVLSSDSEKILGIFLGIRGAGTGAIGLLSIMFSSLSQDQKLLIARTYVLTVTGLSLLPLLLGEFSQAVLDLEATMKRRRSSAATVETSLMPPKNSAKKPTHLFVWRIVAGLRPFAWAWSS